MNPSVNNYDYIVIGSGAGGGTFAGIAAVSGAKVLLIERGSGAVLTGNDHLVNQRLSVYGHNAGPDARHIRIVDGHRVVPWSPTYQANAAMLGGGTQVYGAQAWRFHPIDFQMATAYGIPEGSSLADWPITYTDIEPWYQVAERYIGVSGDAESMSHLPNYKKPYPMPAISRGEPGNVLKRGIDTLNWRSCRVPLAINTIPYDGRNACTRCQECVGFTCHANAKNGTQNTWILRGLSTGNLDVITDTVVTKLDHCNGEVVGITLVGDQSNETTIKCSNLICAAGAIETARLLLASGLQNDHLGCHLQGHVYTGVTGQFSENIWDGLGPGPTTAVTEFLHGNDGFIGGGMLADEFVMTPITYWKRHREPRVSMYGPDAKSWMIDTYPKVLDIKGPIQDIPSPECRVTVSPSASDTFGMPLTQLTGFTHPESIRVSRHMFNKAKELMMACGAEHVWGNPQRGPVRSAGQHQAGTCRMAESVHGGVVDTNQRVFGFSNLYVCDASVHVTNGTFNPVLTVYALAHRLAAHLTGWKPE